MPSHEPESEIFENRHRMVNFHSSHVIQYLHFDASIGEEEEEENKDDNSEWQPC